MKTYTTYIAIALFAWIPVNATIWYVHPDSALNSIQTGIDSAQYGDTVLVAAAVYNTSSGEVFPLDMDNGVALLSEQGAASTIIDADSAGRVMICDNTDNSTLIAGFTIRNGCAGGDTLIDTTFVDSCGGGILCSNSSTVIITDNIILGNSAIASGGGIYSDLTSSPTIMNNTIQSNTSQWRGGGLCCSGQTRVLNNIVVSNNASEGGGLASENSSRVTIENNLVTRNEAGTGGGIASVASVDSIIGNRIVENHGQSGGGILCNWSTAYIERNIIKGNSASDGGGLFLYGSNGKVERNVIAFNSTSFVASALATGFSTFTISGNTIVSNLDSQGLAGAVFLRDIGQVITNNAIMDNGCGIFIRQFDCHGALINYNNLYYNTYQPNDYEIWSNSYWYQGIDARHNWWNTTDSTTIASYIHETYGSGHVLFVPFLDAPEINAPKEPACVAKVIVMSDSTYTVPLTQPVSIGETLYIQLEGSDTVNLPYIDPAIVIVTSVKDMYGIGVALIETDTMTSLYRGTAYISDISSDRRNEIGVYSQDTIIIYANTDSTKCDTVIVDTEGIEQGMQHKPSNRIGLQTYPNPFSASATIRYSVVKQAPVSLQIYSACGRLEKAIVDCTLEAGEYTVHWDGRDGMSNMLPAGVYFLQLKAGEYTIREKLIFIR